MRSFYSVLKSFFILLLATTQYAYSSNKEEWDSASDQQIKSCLRADTFQNISVKYSYENQNCKLRIIFNPLCEQILLRNGQPSRWEFYYAVFSNVRVHKNLERHLREIVEDELRGTSGGVWILGGSLNKQLLIDYFAGATAASATSKADTTLDQEIHDLFKGQTFTKLCMNYQWGKELYLVDFVYNPMREVLFCSALSKPVGWPFAVTIAASSYPLSLAKHIRKLIPSELLEDSDSVIDIADSQDYSIKNSFSVYNNLCPVLLLNKIDNPDVDAAIQTRFTSNQLNKTSLCYELDGDFYGVFLIHNPERLYLTSTVTFNTQENGRLSHTASWNSKIGIFVDKKAPQELIDHISQLFPRSWWDNYWNFSIHNGDEISMTYYNPWRYEYTLDSWYTFMVHAEP